MNDEYYKKKPLEICFRPHYGSGLDSASIRNEYQEYFLGGKGGQCVGLTTLPNSHADCHEFWEPQPPVPLKACTGIPLPLPASTVYVKPICFQYCHCVLLQKDLFVVTDIRGAADK